MNHGRDAIILANVVLFENMFLEKTGRSDQAVLDAMHRNAQTRDGRRL